MHRIKLHYLKTILDYWWNRLRGRNHDCGEGIPAITTYNFSWGPKKGEDLNDQ